MNFKILKLPGNHRVDDFTYNNILFGIHTMELETGHPLGITNHPGLLIVCFSSRQLTNLERINQLKEWDLGTTQ